MSQRARLDVSDPASIGITTRWSTRQALLSLIGACGGLRMRTALLADPRRIMGELCLGLPPRQSIMLDSIRRNIDMRIRLLNLAQSQPWHHELASLAL